MSTVIFSVFVLNHAVISLLSHLKPMHYVVLELMLLRILLSWFAGLWGLLGVHLEFSSKGFEIHPESKCVCEQCRVPCYFAISRWFVSWMKCFSILGLVTQIVPSTRLLLMLFAFILLLTIPSQLLWNKLRPSWIFNIYPLMNASHYLIGPIHNVWLTFYFKICFTLYIACQVAALYTFSNSYFIPFIPEFP